MSVYKPQPGDRVVYSARFIRSIQGDEVADRVGTVREIIEGRVPRARVEWDDQPGELSSALPVNLARAGSWRAADVSATR
jgi:hypothetical protein